MRINQFLARAGLASRRKSEDLVRSGRVFVSGQKVVELATEIDAAKDSVTVDGKVISLPEHRYLMLNKPAGYTTTRLDKHAEHTIFELLPPDDSLISVGRLDKWTTGLILLTNDGDFAQRIIHPSQGIEKEYHVTTQKSCRKEQVEKLITGVSLEDGPAKAKKLKIISETEFILVIEEGRNRIVRRMVEAIGAHVSKLERTRIGALKLDIPNGKTRSLTPEEVAPYA